MTERPSELLPFPDGTVEGPAGISIGGVPLTTLARDFGTPLYVYDASTLRRRAGSIVSAVSAAPSGGRAAFALKSLSTLAVLRLLREEGMGADCASAGEIAAAVRAGFAGASLVIHGNAKSDADLPAALPPTLYARGREALFALVVLGLLILAFLLNDPRKSLSN